jgi:biopolymer transport protein ExbB
MFHTLAQGGWVMVLIGVSSLAGLTIVIERFVALRRARVIDPQMLRLTGEYNERTVPESALKACRQSDSAFARVLEETIKARHLHHDQVIETMHATGRTQVGQLERGLTLLEVVANVSPLLGLLGTVLGMITVFNAITVEGIGNARVLSGGISQALVTTVAGLCVAIPASAFHSVLARRVDDYATEMQERATGFIVKLLAIEQRRRGQ